MRILYTIFFLNIQSGAFPYSYINLPCKTIANKVHTRLNNWCQNLCVLGQI